MSTDTSSKLFIGSIMEVSGHPPEYYIEVSSTGDYIRLNMTDAQISKIPINEKLVVTVENFPDDDGRYTVLAFKGMQSVGRFSNPVPSTEKKKVHMAIYRVYDLGASEETLASGARGEERNAAKVQAFYRREFGHIWDVECRGYSFASDESVYPPNFARLDRKKFLESREDQAYQPNYHMLHAGSHSSYCGQAGVGTGGGITYFSGDCGVRTMCHEYGHELGLHHASTLRGEDTVEYGDTSSAMGSWSGQNLKGFNSPQRVFFNSVPDDAILRPTETQQVILCPLELSEWMRPDGVYKSVILERTGFDPIYLATRLGLYEYSGGGYNGLQVHSLITPRRNKTLLTDTLTVGGDITLANFRRVEVLEDNGSFLRVNVYMKEDDPRPANILMPPEGFPPRFPAVELSDRHSGSWFDPNCNGQGFDLFVKNGRMVIAWYTYNMTNGCRRFYFGTCDLVDGMEEFDLTSTDKGTWADPTKHKDIPAGKAQLFFLDDNTGIFNYDTPEHGPGTVELTALVKSEGNQLDGVWFQESRDGEGFTLRVAYNEELKKNLCSGFWYSYGPIGMSPSNYSTNALQRWYAMVGDMDDTGSYNMKIFELRERDNACFHMKDSPEETQVGTAKITLLDNDTVTFEYDQYGTDRANGKGMFNLTRLL